MAWFEEAVFYHIYPLGLTGAPLHNDQGETVHRLNDLIPWIGHIADIGCNALYIGPLFESVGHGYETSDYRKLDRRLGDNDDLKNFVRICHENGIRVVLDAVFNHTGREFFAFRDIRENRENSPYLYWYQNVNLYGDNEYHDGFSYDTWAGYDLLPKLNQRNPEVVNYHLDTVRFWVDEFDIDGLRLDVAQVLDFDFMHQLRLLANEIKDEFWLMGEVIHGEYDRWVGPSMLHSVTNYHLNKALFSGHNDHHYFEIAHTVNRLLSAGKYEMSHLYNFVDNHDVERIHTILSNKADFFPVHVLLYTLPGIPSIYYGSEYGIDGKKERYSDASLRPYLNLNELEENDCIRLIRALGKIRQNEKALSYGDYWQLQLSLYQYAFARGDIIVTVNSASENGHFDLNSQGIYKGALSGTMIESDNGVLHIDIGAHSGEIWIPQDVSRAVYEPLEITIENKEKDDQWQRPERADKPYKEMSVEELQAEILAKMEANGPLNERMIRDVRENVWRDSLLNWVKSFR